MKIVLLTEYFLPVKGGIEIHCYNLANELILRGFNVEIHTSASTPLFKNVLKEKEKMNGIIIKRTKNFKFYVPKNINFIDILHIHNFNILPHAIIFLLILFRKLLNLQVPKVVITLHGGFTPYWIKFPLVIRIIKKIYNYTIGIFFLKKVVDKIICVNSWECEILSRLGLSNKIKYVPNGVDELAYKLSVKKQTMKKQHKYLLYIGRINRIKKIELSFFAIKNINNINLLIAGPITDIEYFLYLKKIIKKMKLEKRIFFIGEVWGEKKYRLIDSAFAVVLTSDFETEPIIIKEAMARGKPVIVSSIPAFKTLVQHNVNGYIVSNYIDIYNAIFDLLNNKNKYKIISYNNKKISKRWKWKIISELIIKIYKS